MKEHISLESYVHESMNISGAKVQMCGKDFLIQKTFRHFLQDIAPVALFREAVSISHWNSIEITGAIFFKKILILCLYLMVSFFGE